jgi:hypothetical protein
MKVFTYGLFTILTLGLMMAFWLGHFVRPQPDYASMGMCSAQQIDKTVIAINANKGWRDAALLRLNNDIKTKTFRPYSLNWRLDWYVNLMVNEYYARRHTAAWQCNEAYVHFSGEKALRSLPTIVEQIRPVSNSESEAWELSTCLSISPRHSLVYPKGFAIDDRLKSYCHMRKEIVAQRR